MGQGKNRDFVCIKDKAGNSGSTVGPPQLSDLLIWIENVAMKFTVKTAYRLALRLNKQPWAEHSQSRAYKPIWRGIWALNVPPKVQTFLWRACSNCLPTRENL